MASFDRTSSQSLTDIIERFMQEERIVVDAFRARIASAEGSDFQSVLEKLTEIRERYIAELESACSEITSRAHITNQINNMFL